jgi:hypothetical protein
MQLLLAWTSHVPLAPHSPHQPAPQLALPQLLCLALALAEAAFQGAGAALPPQLRTGACASALGSALQAASAALDGALRPLRAAEGVISEAALRGAGEVECAALCAGHCGGELLEAARCLLIACAQLKPAHEWFAAEGAWIVHDGMRHAFVQDAAARLAAAVLHREDGRPEGLETWAGLQRLPQAVEALRGISTQLQAAAAGATGGYASSAAPPYL